MATTTGFVQQWSLLTGPLGCFRVGEDAASAELLFVAVANNDSGASIAVKTSRIAALVEASATGRRVSVGHEDDSAEVLSVGYPVDTVATRPVQLEGIEVTQAVQDVSQSVPLLAGKRTVVRVYLSNYGTAGIPVAGQISLRKAPTDPPVVVNSTATVVLNPADAGNLAAVRNDANRSLNFVVPATMVSEGPLAIRLSGVTDVLTGSPLAIGGERRPIVTFHRSAPLRVRVYGVRYFYGTPPVTHLPTDRDFELLLSWLARAYPAGQVLSTRVLVTATEPDVPPKFKCGDVNAQIAAIRALDVDAGEDQRTHYYAMVSDGGFYMRGCAGVPVTTPDPGAVGSGPTGSATWGWDFDGSYGDWYGGHEIGHTFGRQHPGFCDESNDDDDYPYPGGQLGGDDKSIMGFDVGDPALGIPIAALPGTQWKDVMTYCDYQWLSAYTYLGILRRLRAEDGLGSGSGAPFPGALTGAGGRPDARFPRAPRRGAEPAQPGPTERAVSVVATVNVTRGRGRIRFVNPVLNVRPSTFPAQGPVQLRVIRADGTAAAEYPVEVRLNSDRDPGDDEVGLVDVQIPVDADATALELVVAGQVVDTFRAAPAPPDPRGLRTVPAGAAELRLATEFADALVAGQSYVVQVSTTGGRTWSTVAVGLSDPEISLDRRQFAPGQEVMVRVIGTNGFTRSVVATETFRA